MNSTKKIAFIAVGWFLVLIPGLVGIEITLRYLSDDWSPAEAINIVRDRTMKISVNHLYESGKDYITYTRDEYGLRHSCSEGAGAIDILTIGGSTTDQRYIDDALTFQSVLEKKLSKTLGKKVCVANAGIDGHSTYGHMAAFQRWFPLIPDLKPKLVLLYVGINDVSFDRTGKLRKRFEEKQIDPNGFKRFLKEFEIVKSVIRLRDIVRGLVGFEAFSGHMSRMEEGFTEENLSSDTPELADINASEFGQRLAVLLEDIGKMGSSPVCVTQPHRMAKNINGKFLGIKTAFHANEKVYNGLDYDLSIRKINSIMLRLCGNDRVLDLYNYPFEDRHFYDRVHMTPEGADAVGNQMAKEMIEKGIIKEL